MALSQSDAIQWFMGDTLADNVEISEPLLTLLVTYFESLADSVEMAEALANPPLGVPLVEALTINLQDYVGSGAQASDVISAQAFVEAVRGHVVAHAEALSIDDDLLSTAAKHIRDAIAVLSAAQPNWRTGVNLTDQTSIAAVLLGGWAALAQDTVSAADALNVVRGAVVAEQLGIQFTQSATASYRLSISDALRLRDSLGRFFGAEALDGVTVSPALLGIAQLPGVATDQINVSEATVAQLHLRVIASDRVEIDAVQALQAIYSQRVLDGVELSAAYLSPGGTFTAWAMNTRTGYVTEYDNFEFNSFASMGNKYIAASGSGLYELNGDTDAGADIIARLKSGYMQFGGTKLSRLKSAYIATRGGGDFVLKIETGDGATYTYAVDSRNMRSSKVHMGKGQRARYFSFELTSAGQDFDLDTLEFVPVVVERRV